MEFLVIREWRWVKLFRQSIKQIIFKVCVLNKNLWAPLKIKDSMNSEIFHHGMQTETSVFMVNISVYQ